jgi:hypothetical protein
VSEPVLHPWFRSTTGVVVMSHHGLEGPDAPVGSLAAYLAAYELGYRWFQVDVVPIRDDLISHHAVFGTKRGFTSLTLAEARARLGYDVPTLAELLVHPGLVDARWNVEIKSRRGVRALVRTLRDTTSRAPVMVSAPMHFSIARDIRDAFGEKVAGAAPWMFGGALGIPLRHATKPFHTWQVHRFLAARARRHLDAGVVSVQSWTIGTPAQADACLAAGCHPIVGEELVQVRDHLRAAGVWPEVPRFLQQDAVPPVEPTEAPAGPAVVDHPTIPITRVLLGGGGWRGAFGSIGAVMYLRETGRWAFVDEVVAISGGSFVAGALGTDGVVDTDPAVALGDLAERLLALRWRLYRAGASLAVLVPAVVFPPALLFGARRLLTWHWRRALPRVVGSGAPRGEGGRRYVICAAGLESARAHFYVSGGRGTATVPDWGSLVPDGWRIDEAVRSSTALPWVDGSRTPDRSGAGSPFVDRGEVLVDGGVLGIFGSQFHEQPPWLPGTADTARTLVVDAGRAHRRGSRWGARLLGLSTVMMLARWIQLTLDAALRREVARASLPDDGDGPARMTHLVRVAETDDGDRQAMLALFSEPHRRIEHGRRVVQRFGLFGMNAANAHTTIVVSVAACAVDLEAEPTVASIRAQLVHIGEALGLGSALAEVWDDL